MRLAAILPICLCAMFCSLAAQAATQWHCGAALAPEDTRLGTSNTQFELRLYDNGDFTARETVMSAQTKVDWRWRGVWTEVEGQIAMIGLAVTQYSDPMLIGPNEIETELRAFSALNQSDVLILNLKARQHVSLIRCLKEPL